MMRVSELLELLKEMDPDAPIILAKTSDGGEYAPIEDLTTGFWNSKTQEVLTDEDVFEVEIDDDDEDTLTKNDGVSSVVLWPEW